MRKRTWESYEWIWDPYSSLDILSLAFINRRCSSKNFDSAEFGQKNRLTFSSAGEELMMSLG